MDQQQSLIVLFIVNPISGGKEKTDHEDAINAYFKNLPHSIHFFKLTNGDDTEEIKKLIAQIKPHKVVAVGGDGTVTMVAKITQGTPLEMCILPAGSANGMARELNIPLVIEDALDIILHGQVKSADLIKINNEICLHLSDIGLNARLIKYFEEGNIRGKLGYAKVALKALYRKQSMQVIIHTKDREIKRDAIMVAMANATKYGTGAVINPEGNLYDGLFEVIVIRKIAVSELFKMWFRPQPFDPQNIEVICAKSVDLETKHPVHFQVDGEFLGKVNHVHAQILPAALKLVVPADEAIKTGKEST